LSCTARIFAMRAVLFAYVTLSQKLSHAT